MDKRILETILSDQAEELELIDKTVSICAFYVGLHLLLVNLYTSFFHPDCYSITK